MGIFSKNKLEELENKYIQDYLQMKSDIEDLKIRMAYKSDYDRVTKLEERISDLEMEDTHIDKRFSELQDRFEDLWVETCELLVFKDFVEQLIRDTSDNMIDISVYVEELQTMFKNAAELTDVLNETNAED